MKRIPGSAKNQRQIIPFVALLLFSFLAFRVQPVIAQMPFEVNWTFDYSPLVSGAPNTVHLRVSNTAFAPVRLLSVGINFPWMQANVYFSTAEMQSVVDIPPQQEVTYTILFQTPANALTGRYTMNTLLQYEMFQAGQYGGQEAIAYVLNVVVLGRTSSYSFNFDLYDGRFYSALALLTLIGWYIPKRLRFKAKVKG